MPYLAALLLAWSDYQTKKKGFSKMAQAFLQNSCKNLASIS
jgi:hypothetical protein